MSGKPINEADFVEMYGQTPITMGTRQLPLSTALEMEAAFCPADPDKRETEEQRLRFLAQKIGEDSLRPEHAYLLSQPVNKG